MARFELDRIDELVKGVTSARLLDAGALAGTGVIAPLVALRARSAARELTRIELQEGPESPAAARQRGLVAVLKAREGEIANDLARRLGPQAEPGAGEAVVDGQVTRRGKPVAGALVKSASDDKTSNQACTDRDGRFSMPVPANVDIRLAVTADSKILHRDDRALAYPPGYRAYRAIEVDEAEPVCDDGPEDVGTVDVPSLVGNEREQAEKHLAGIGLKPGRVTLVAGKAGIILGQAPKAGAKAKLGDAVALRVGKGENGRTPGPETKSR